MTEYNWSVNCLTTGIYHGRQEPLWRLPLGYAQEIYPRDLLKRMIVARIFNDAKEFVLTDAESFPMDWANRVKDLAERKFGGHLTVKLEELEAYYTSKQFKRERENMLGYVQVGDLNRHYQPLHLHDSLNVFCRILGTQSSMDASHN